MTGCVLLADVSWRLADVDWPATLLVSTVLTVTVSIALFIIRRVKGRDEFELGFACGLHSQLTKIVKIRYSREHDLCIAVVPKEEYDREVDQVRG